MEHDRQPPPQAAASKLAAAAAFFGATGVLLGAYGAHGLATYLAQHFPPEVASARAATYETAVRYQLVHAVAILVLATVRPGPDGKWCRRSGWTMAAGVVVFSGLLYVLAFAGQDWRWLGAVVPLGGLSMTAGWCLAGYAACRRD